MRPLVRLPDRTQLQQVFRGKYGPPDRLGWGPQLRQHYQYFNPDDWYEAVVASLVVRGTQWLDVGCGHELFPSNPELARLLAARAGLLVGVDPDPSLQQNPYVHQKAAVAIDDYDGGGRFE